jgi:copper oxidase (laccase) domain-containing protein
MAARTVAEMGAKYGCRPGDLVAGIGPAIGPCCYEVGQDVVAAVRATFGGAAAPLLASHSNGRWLLDLWEANAMQLARAGVEQVEVARICTSCDTTEWFSHRAEGGRTGRMGALIALRG